MLVTRKSMVTGKERTLDLPITEEQVARYNAGALIQDVFPNLSASDRVFILLGVTDDEWDEMFPKEKPEDEPAF